MGDAMSAKRLGQRLDLRPVVHLGDTDQHVVLELGIVLAQVVAAQDAPLVQAAAR